MSSCKVRAIGYYPVKSRHRRRSGRNRPAGRRDFRRADTAEYRRGTRVYRGSRLSCGQAGRTL